MAKKNTANLTSVIKNLQKLDRALVSVNSNIIVLNVRMGATISRFNAFTGASNRSVNALKNLKHAFKDVKKISKETGKAMDKASPEIKNVQGNSTDKCKSDSSSKSTKKVEVDKSQKDILKDKIGVLKENPIIKIGIKYFKAGLDMADEMDKMEKSLKNTLGDDKLGEKLFNHLCKNAKKSTLSFKDLKENSDKFLSSVETVGQLDSLNNMTERLSVVGGEDVKGSREALTKALSGDTKDLTKKFDISEKDIKASGFKSKLKAGDTEGAIRALDKLLEKSGYANDAMLGMTGGIKAQMKMIKDTVGESLGKAMMSTQEKIAPLFQKINEFLQNGALEPFINMFVGGLNIIAEGVQPLIQALEWVMSFLMSNQEVVYAILTGLLVGALIPITMALWAVVVAAFNAAVAFIAMNWPILLIIGGIMIMIFCLMKFGKFAEVICGYVAGAIGALVTFLYNLGASIINKFSAFSDFLFNVFNNPIAAVQKLFLDLVSDSLKLILKLVQGFEGLLNLFGVKSNFSAQIEGVINWVDSKEQAISKKNGLKSSKKIEFKDFKEEVAASFTMGSEFGKTIDDGLKDVMDKAKGFMPGQNEESLGSDQKIGDGIELKNGSDPLKVDMEEDEMAYLKDLAERDYIAKYNTSTLAPNVQIQFGDIKETADVNEVAKAMEKILREEIAMAAEGV